MRLSYPLLALLCIPLSFAFLLGGFFFHGPVEGAIDPTTIKSQTIVSHSQTPNKTLDLGTFSVTTVLLPTPTTTPMPSATPIPPSVVGIGTHGAFNIYTLDEALKAHTAGVEYDIIQYNNPLYGQDLPLNPTSPIGKALRGYGMKSFMDLVGSDITGVTANGSIYLNEATLIKRVTAVYNNDQNPLLGGYWIKDDDQQICGSGQYSLPVTAKVQRAYQLIRQIDKDPSHIIIAGFCTNADLQKNYHPSVQMPMADAVATYPYPNLYGNSFVGGNINSEVSAEASTVRANTPAGVTPPVLLGIYEGFWSTCHTVGTIVYHCPLGISPISQTELMNDANAFMNNGFAGLIDFSFEASDVDKTGGTDSTMLSYVQDITNYLISIGRY